MIRNTMRVKRFWTSQKEKRWP
jgi:hypothetical protein